MMNLRSAARQSALRLSRISAPTARCECGLNHPHAESSYAAFRRFASSAAAAATTSSGTASPVGRGGQGRNRDGKRILRPNPRLRKQAMINAKRLFDAIHSENPSSTSPSPSPTSATSVSTSTSLPSLSSSQNSSSWTDVLSPSSTSAQASSSQPSNTTSTPSLSDLLSKRPDTPPPNPWHHAYPRLHQQLHNSMDSAFVAKQMRVFAKEMGLQFGRGERMNKGSIIKKIMDSWGWVEPRDRPEERIAEEKVFDLPAPELFLFLRDNDLVQQFIQEENVQFSVIPAMEARNMRFRSGDQRRMVLSARGSDDALQSLDQILTQRQESLRTIEFTIDEVHGMKANVELLQLVSNAAGAYVEPVSDNSYRATAMNVHDAEDARRLLSMASLRTRILSSTRPNRILLPVPSHFQAHAAEANTQRSDRFSLYPFNLSLTEPLAWDQSASVSNQTMFRLRKVSQWTSKPARRELDHRQEDLAKGGIRHTNTRGGLHKGQNQTLNELVDDMVSPIREGDKTTVKIRTGHLLFGVEPRDGSSVGTFDSPLPGQWPVENAQKWIGSEEDRRPIFAPSLTPAMTQFPIPGSALKIHRLQYRSSPVDGKSKTVIFTCALPAGRKAEKAEEEVKWQDQLGEMLDKMEKELALENESQADVVAGSESSEVPVTVEASADSVAESAQVVEKFEGVEGTEAVSVPDEPLVIKAEIGAITEINIFLPDRPIDIQIISESTRPVSDDQTPEQIGAVFQEYVAGAQFTRPPSSVTIQGETYDIESDEELEIVTESEEEVLKRCVKVKEQGFNGRPVTYSEIETSIEGGSVVSSSFWAQLASITRDIGPDAAALKKGNLFD
ncbi:hypothetical protein IAR55_000465 [Kwoniella newhampshirensis]|uniref:Uncharacterized protein n=1 Tax=Kwoniella newhampshirensis TaxID=1651941 RepID=A0AAW0Z6Q8_9TREE